MNTNTNINSRSNRRFYAGWFFLVLAVVIWIPSGDLVDMIIRQKEIVLGRYSRGHFGALFFLTLVFLGISALCFSKIKTVGEMVLIFVMVSVSAFVSGFVLVIGSAMFSKPRYVEQEVTTEKNGIETKGMVRHRPANEHYQLLQKDVPEQHRSYPYAPAGYPTFDVTLTSDRYGFRNQTSLDHYPIVAVGDSFVAGSHVSDEQAWVSLLSKKMNTDIYNLGASGVDPGIYWNNFVLLGQQFKPKLVLFMIYEGNDFKRISPVIEQSETSDRKNRADNNKNRDKNNNKNKDKNKDKNRDKNKEKNKSRVKEKDNKKSLSEQIKYWAEASPVTMGLNRFSREVLEPIGKDKPVPGFQETVGWMPLKVGDHYYGFEPKRLTYLYEGMDEFMTSKSWQSVKQIMQNMVTLGQQQGFQVVFVYAPSTPHVVMPLVRDAIPADQLRNFAAYQKDNLPPAEKFKENMFLYMNNEENIFLEQCGGSQWNCISLTSALQEATANGQQVYYSYDQHWTPDGNRVVADTINNYLMTYRLSQLGSVPY